MRLHLSALAAFSLTLASTTALANPALEAAQQAAAAAEASDAKPVWAFEESDLPVDPAFRFGVLPNGMRYIIRHNATPAGTGEVRLLIQAGSISETESELGYAHFIEHMAFNGSKNVPEAEMVKLLEREGLAFGADTNASTGFDNTTYQLGLPRNDPALLDTALMLMRETAGNLTFDQGAIDREKGVVLSEKRVRDTYALRNTIDQLEFFYPRARFTHRLPIGTSDALQGATSAALKALYARMYTPQNATLVVVGDFDPDLVEQKIKAHFADWSTPAAPPQPDAGPIDAALAGKTGLFIDPALSERITASRNGAFIDEKDTAESRFRNVLRQVGYGIVNRRLQRLANQEKPPFRSAGFGTDDLFKEGRTTSLVVNTAEGQWHAGLRAAVEEYRRALAYGFTEAEVAEQLANLRASIENTAATADTRSNAAHVSAALSLIMDDKVPTTPESSLARFNALVPRVTPDAVLAALQEEAVPLDDPLLRFEGRTAPEGGADALRAAWNEAAAAPVERRDDQAASSFAYTDFGAPGAVVEDHVDPRMGIREIRFANGVRLNLKRTDLQKDRVSFELNLDGGDMLNTRDNPLATELVSSMVFGGLGRHTFDDLQSVLAGRDVSLGIQSDEETFRIAGATTPRDLELQLELLAAGITDPGYRSQGEERYRRSVADFFARRDATPGSALGNALGGIVSDGDPRFTIQPEDAYLSLDYAKLKADIGDRLAHGAIELALVGDFDEDQAIALVARTLGALPAREADFRDYAANRTRGFTADRSPRIVTHDGEADQALLRLTWPTTDDEDLKESLALTLLERVVQVELTDVLREALGQTYSPSVDASQSRVYKGYGTFSVSASLAVTDVDAARKAVDETLGKLRGEPLDADVLLRARRPLLESYDNALKTNEGWLGLVDRAQSESERIDRFLKAKALLEGFTGEDMRALAAKYLDPKQALEAVALPGKKAEPGKETAP